jgi:SAM-dependent methyltransferase
MPVDAKEHYKIKPKFPHSRWYCLKELKKLIEFARDEYILKIKNIEKIKLADFGCGTKPYYSLFDLPNIEYLGIDLPWNPHAEIKIDIDSKIEADNGVLDVILSTQVLEHVDNPQTYLSEAYRVLKKDGLLVLTTHGYWMYHPDPTDFWRWTSAGLKKIVEKEGFEVIAFKGMLGRMASGLQLFQDGLIFKFPVWIRPIITAPMQLFILLADKLQNDSVRDMDACNYLIICRKKEKILK